MICDPAVGVAQGYHFIEIHQGCTVILHFIVDVAILIFLLD
jgi:hypothetical protein